MPVAKEAKRVGAFNERLKQALTFHKEGFALKHAPLIVAAKNEELAGYVKLADKLLVDVRWLATGEESPAGTAAASRVRLSPAFAALPEREQRELLDCLKLTPQPSLCPGTCRYCGCTPERIRDSCEAAGGCDWVDRQQTICTACLLEQP
jgi:hypothetical protein